MKEIMRSRLRHALKGKVKPTTTMALVGCSIEELLEYLQTLLPPGANLGDYHVDHILPCAAFDLSDPEQIKQCFHYTNLQPLPPAENLAKSDKLPYERVTLKLRGVN